MNDVRTFTLISPTTFDEPERAVGRGVTFADGTAMVKFDTGAAFYDSITDVPNSANDAGELEIRFDDANNAVGGYAPKARGFDRTLQDRNTSRRSLQLFDQSDGTGVTFDFERSSTLPTTLSNADVRSLRDQLSAYLADVEGEADVMTQHGFATALESADRTISGLRAELQAAYTQRARASLALDRIRDLVRDAMGSTISKWGLIDAVNDVISEARS